MDDSELTAWGQPAGDVHVHVHVQHVYVINWLIIAQHAYTCREQHN
jgi:hypothetical protein